MTAKAKFNATNVLNAFAKYYPMLKPKAVYYLPDGFLIYAPMVENGTDYGDPYYRMDVKFTTAQPFNMRDRKQMFAAFKAGPIWEK